MKNINTGGKPITILESRFNNIYRFQSLINQFIINGTVNFQTFNRHHLKFSHVLGLAMAVSF